MRQYIYSPADPYRVMLPETSIHGLRALNGLGNFRSAYPGLNLPQPMGMGSQVPLGKLGMAAAATSLATAAAVTPPPANIILGAAAAIVSILSAAGVGQGCGQTCIQATSIVNRAEPAFLANVQQYENGEISQAQAQQTWNNLWLAVQGSCAAIPGPAGQDCVNDRAQGACKWRQTPNGDTLGLPGVPQVGECWNWYSGYYEPLTYPPVVSNSGSPAQSSATPGVVGNNNTFLFIVAAVVTALAIGGSN